MDVTTEDELLRTVPYLTKQPNTELYHVQIANFQGWQLRSWLPSLLFRLWPPKLGEGPVQDKWAAMDFPSKVAYVLGWRYLSFSAGVLVSNGIVCRVMYDIEPDVLVGYPVSYFVHVQTVHGFLRSNRQPIYVDSTGEENPDFRFGSIAGQFSWLEGKGLAIAVAYTTAAPPELVAHAFQFNLSCYWGIWGCHSVRQVVPALWQDRKNLEAKTKTRLASANPCPDELLAGRVRTLPDLTIALRGQLLFFDGAIFDSCRVVPATPSALFAIRNAVPAPRRNVDYLVEGRL